MQTTPDESIHKDFVTLGGRFAYSDIFGEKLFAGTQDDYGYNIGAHFRHYCIAALTTLYYAYHSR